MLLQTILVLKINGSKTTDLRIEELSRVEHSLFLLSRHFIEQIGVIGMFYQINSAVCIFLLVHICENTFRVLLSAYPRC